MRRTPSFVGLAEEVGEVGEVRLLVLLVGLVRQDWAAETCPNSQIASQVASSRLYLHVTGHRVQLAAGPGSPHSDCRKDDQCMKIVLRLVR